jgi:deoxyribonuclease-4
MQCAIDEARSSGINTLQVFTKNQRQWKDKTFTQEDGQAFKAVMKRSGILTAVSHCTYLINLASATDEIREKSLQSLISELERCETMGIAYAVLHPGSNKDISQDECCIIIADAIKVVLQKTKGYKVKLLLENTAGQGSSIGFKIEHLQKIIDLVKSERLGICIDTCHAFAAGYDLREIKGIKSFFKEIDSLIGLEKLFVFHINDSKADYGSRVDRHAHIGKGKMGLEAFRYIMNNFPEIPKIVETDHEEKQHIEDIAVLRSLIKNSK